MMQSAGWSQEHDIRQTWASLCSSLKELLELPDIRWQYQQPWFQLASVLGEISEYAELYAPPARDDGSNSMSLVCWLCLLARVVLAGELPAFEPQSSACRRQLLTCLTQILSNACSSTSTGPYGSEVLAVGPITAAQTITLAVLVPQLAHAAGEAAHKLQSAEPLPEVCNTDDWQLTWQQGQAETMHDAAVVLRLALAVAAVWPGGIVASSAARCLAGGWAGSCKKRALSSCCLMKQANLWLTLLYTSKDPACMHMCWGPALLIDRWLWRFSKHLSCTTYGRVWRTRWPDYLPLLIKIVTSCYSAWHHSTAAGDTAACVVYACSCRTDGPPRCDGLAAHRQAQHWSRYAAWCLTSLMLQYSLH
jgi:hypothetical protein